MYIRRRPAPATITTVPRSAVEHAHHRNIDAILKDLKLCSRRLRSALECFKDELQTLERLYYKCKNQHRMALFFKRVPEMRRYGHRLSEMEIQKLVDLLRASFVGLEYANDHKALRCSWSRLPQKSYVSFLTGRLTACSTLVCKMRERLENAYCHFTLAMRTGAFVQSIILFVAISSRMSTLSSQLEEALQLGISTCNRLLIIIHPTCTHSTLSSQSLPESETLHPSRIDHDLSSEDIGRVVPHCEPIDTSTLIIEDSSTEMSTGPPAGQFTYGIDDAPASKATTMKAAEKRRMNKVKRRRNEIDEIFASF